MARLGCALGLKVFLEDETCQKQINQLDMSACTALKVAVMAGNLLAAHACCVVCAHVVTVVCMCCVNVLRVVCGGACMYLCFVLCVVC